MHRSRRLGCFLAAAALASLPAFGAVAPPSADTHTSTALPANNFGTSPNINVGGGSTALIRFDTVSSLPPGTVGSMVSKAVLYLYVNRVNVAGAVDVATATSAWAETTVTGASAPVPGAVIATVPVTAAGQWIAVDVTNTVKNWTDFPATNNGFTIAASVGAPTTALVLDSKESTATSNAALLDVTLASSGAQGPTGPQGPTGAVGPTGPQGPSGAQGAAGPTGAQGPAGSVGPTGPQGPSGAQGAAGPTGAQGPAGSVGPTGPQGQQGLQGIQGIPGNQGPIGPTGPAGSNYFLGKLSRTSGGPAGTNFVYPIGTQSIANAATAPVAMRLPASCTLSDFKVTSDVTGYANRTFTVMLGSSPGSLSATSLVVSMNGSVTFGSSAASTGAVTDQYIAIRDDVTATNPVAVHFYWSLRCQ